MAFLLPSRGPITRLRPKTGETFRILELAGYVETLAQWRVLNLDDEMLFYNPDGDDLALAYNETASALAQQGPQYAGIRLYGQCVIARRDEIHEEMIH